MSTSAMQPVGATGPGDDTAVLYSDGWDQLPNIVVRES